MNRLKNKKGMTMAELLIVVAIIAVLGGVSFIAVFNHQRSLGQLERDNIAKEIFVAAQNHLTVAYGQGYLGTNDFGEQIESEESEGIYYYVVNGSIAENSVLAQMLPFGSIDETVRIGGSYIIRYQKDLGIVLDVFYCTRNGSQFDHTLNNGNYEQACKLKGDGNKPLRRECNMDSDTGVILGWYGDVKFTDVKPKTLKPPTIKVYNEERLYVEVEDPNTENNAKCRLLIKGLSSGTERYINVTNRSETIVFDDITTPGGHFSDLEFNDGKSDQFIPGENITIQAIAYNNQVFANIAYSSKSTTNSLFASTKNELGFDGKPLKESIESDEVLETAYIGNIRHLENLDKVVSNLDSFTAAESEEAPATLERFQIKAAVQTSNMSWETFKEKTNKENTRIYPHGGLIAEALTSAGCYYPINPDANYYNNGLTYDGQRHRISDVKVAFEGSAGLFQTTENVHEIKNLMLVDFDVTGTSSAGALAGTSVGCTVTNVIARNSTAKSDVKIKASAGNAGGLIGDLTSGTVQYSGAAVIVEGSASTSASAGGLIGSASNGTTITGCFSGGHTDKGEYYNHTGETPGEAIYNITGGTVGGLVGSSSATISASYSTCSVSGATAGGLIGTKSNGSIIKDSYSTGLVKGTSAGLAFIGRGSLSEDCTGNYYYKIINEVTEEDETKPMAPYSITGEYKVEDHLTQIKPIDYDLTTYNEFVGAWDDWEKARAYDSSLVKYYDSKYTLKTVEELKPEPSINGLSEEYIKDSKIDWTKLFVSTHYGDWPAPEIFFINE